jgi:SOS-response transcriptional repressor LexA
MVMVIAKQEGEPGIQPLTPAQAAILRHIAETFAKEMRPPTVREIGARFGIASPNGVLSHIEALIKKGYLVRTCGKARGLEIVGLAPLIRQTVARHIESILGGT